MKLPYLRLSLLLLSVLAYECRTARVTRSVPTATLASQGFLTCFEPDLKIGTDTVWCEASAVAYQNGKVFIANDKNMPAPRSAVFFYPGTDLTALTTAQPTYLEQPVFRAAKKYEDFARTPDGQWTFLTTGFDRVKEGAADWDGYNTLLAWKTNQEGDAQVVAPTAGDPTSVRYRKNFSAVLNNQPYFKVEGLAALPDALIWGIREEGQKYDNFTYKVKFLRTPYTVIKDASGKDRIQLGETFTVLADFDVAAAHPELPKPLAVSSIEYDPNRHCFWVLTSHEAGGDLSAYLWTIGEKELKQGATLNLVRTASGAPLAFTHKAEDVTIVDRNTLLIIHDDDREKTKIGAQQRQPNQAAYSVVKLN